MAFTGKSAQIIKERSGGASELSGESFFVMHRSHLDHTRSTEYNKPDMGMMVTLIEHYAYHLMFQHAPHMIGLQPAANEWAVEMLLRDVTKWAEFYGYQREEVENMVQQAKWNWEIQLFGGIES